MKLPLYTARKRKGQKRKPFVCWEKDIIEQSKAIWQTKIRGEWHIAEMTEKTRKLFAEIEVVFHHKLE